VWRRRGGGVVVAELVSPDLEAIEIDPGQQLEQPGTHMRLTEVVSKSAYGSRRGSWTGHHPIPEAPDRDE